MTRSWIRSLLAAAFCCFALTAWAATPDVVPTTAPETAPDSEALLAPTDDAAADLEAVETEVDLIALFADDARQWLQPASSGGGGCYNCNTHTDCDSYCAPTGGACLRDLDGVCSPEPLKYCWCF